MFFSIILHYSQKELSFSFHGEYTINNDTKLGQTGVLVTQLVLFAE
jgi:hypothetical protein